jgi:uncharacterized protein
VVKSQHVTGKSYTCQLQKAIYQDNPCSYPAITSPDKQQSVAREYVMSMHPAMAHRERATTEPSRRPVLLIPPELREEKNSLTELIAGDVLLQQLYDDQAFRLQLNDEIVPLRSQILNPQRSLYTLCSGDRVVLHVRRSLFQAHCDEVIRNSLHLQMLRDTAVVYGDEKRTKQEHLFTYQLYYRHLLPSDRFGEEFVMADLSDLLALHRQQFLEGTLNNLFATTSYLRDYHYLKQKQNAFYHIQAINLPFQNFEFYWIDGENTHESN